jgi:hypothetical protein
VAEAFYEPDGDRYRSSELTRGPWDPDAQHAGPPSALLGREIELCEPQPGAEIGRITFEILGPVPLAPLRPSARIVRPGRSVELLEGVLDGPDGPVMRASAWRLRTEPLDLAAAQGGAAGEEPRGGPSPAAEESPPPGPEAGAPGDFFPTGVDVGYHVAMDYRFVAGGFMQLGPATVWMRMRQPLVAGEEPSPLQRLLAAADSGNGVSSALDYRRYLFINTELTVHLTRPMTGEWVCLDAVTRPGDRGIGLAESVLWDERGRLGSAAQTLLVRAR